MTQARYVHGTHDAEQERLLRFNALNNEGFETKLVTDPNAGHQWLAAGPTVIPAWFAAH